MADESVLSARWVMAPRRDDDLCIAGRRELEQVGFAIYCYQVQLLNHGNEAISIVDRKWIRRLASGVDVVQAKGLLGESLAIEPGRSLSYAAFVSAKAGEILQGTYFGRTAGGETIAVTLPTVEL